MGFVPRLHISSSGLFRMSLSAWRFQSLKNTLSFSRSCGFTVVSPETGSSVGKQKGTGPYFTSTCYPSADRSKHTLQCEEHGDKERPRLSVKGSISLGNCPKSPAEVRGHVLRAHTHTHDASNSASLTGSRIERPQDQFN